jgi:hypothetical protein
VRRSLLQKTKNPLLGQRLRKGSPGRSLDDSRSAAPVNEPSPERDDRSTQQPPARDALP